MAKKLTKADLFKIKPAHHIETKQIEEFPDITFGVKVMSAGEQEDYENTLYDLVEKEDGSGLKTVPIRKDSRLKLLIYTICDPGTGELLFDPSDLPELRTWPGTVVKKLFDKAREVNDIGQEKESEEKN